MCETRPRSIVAAFTATAPCERCKSLEGDLRSIHRQAQSIGQQAGTKCESNDTAFNDGCLVMAHAYCEMLDAALKVAGVEPKTLEEAKDG